MRPWGPSMTPPSRVSWPRPVCSRIAVAIGRRRPSTSGSSPRRPRCCGGLNGSSGSLRDEVVLCLDEKPHMQVLVRCCPSQLMRRRQIARREFEYTREGTVTFFVALDVDEGTRWGGCLETNDHRQFLGALGRLARHYRWARRLHLMMDHGSSHIAYATPASWASHPRLRAFYTPPHARWLNQAALWLRACSDKYLQRFDPLSRQHLIDPLEASWPESNRRFAPPFSWSWGCRDLYAWARKKATVICSKTYATVH